MNEVNELFTKENVEKIYVPDIVKDDLLSIIEEKLRKAGFYYRVAYRVKAPDSMLNKLILKDYRRPGTDNQDKKMQDLIGIRIILYYAEIDGTILSEVKQGRDGASIKLADRMKALQWLSDHMNMATEEQKAKVEQMKARTEQIQHSGNNNESDAVQTWMDAVKKARESDG